MSDIKYHFNQIGGQNLKNLTPAGRLKFFPCYHNKYN